MKKYIRAIILFIFPAYICRYLIMLLGGGKIGKGVHIGFSMIIVNELNIGDNANIGHFNIVKCNKLYIGAQTQFRHFNFAKGHFNVIIGENTWFNHSNKFSKLTPHGTTVSITEIFIGNHASINTNITFDLSDSITIEDGTVLAGSGTQIWTHSFYKSRINLCESVKVTKPVNIGKNCYIGSNCGIMPGVCIGNGITVGSMTCVSKSLNKEGLYVSQPIRYIEFDPDAKIAELKENIKRI